MVIFPVGSETDRSWATHGLTHWLSFATVVRMSVSLRPVPVGMVTVSSDTNCCGAVVKGVVAVVLGFVEVVCCFGVVVVVVCDFVDDECVVLKRGTAGPHEKELWTNNFPFGHIHEHIPSTQTAPVGSNKGEQAEHTVFADGVQFEVTLNPGSHWLHWAQMESALDWHLVR